MEDIGIQEFKDFIYQDAWSAIPLAYQEIMKLFDCDWQLYQDSEKEKLEWIDSALKDMRENLVMSQFKTQFPLDVIKDNLSTTLKDYCNLLPIYITPDGIYYACDGHVENLFGSFTVKRNNYKFLFSYSQIEYLKPLVCHLALYQIYIEFKRRKAEILEKPAIELHKVVPELTLKETSIEEEKSPYICECQHIFKNQKARRIFEYFHTNLVNEKNHLADYTFIFRRMQRDGYIFGDIKEKAFRDFLARNLDIEIDYKLKPDGYNITDSKEKIYSNAISSF